MKYTGKLKEDMQEVINLVPEAIVIYDKATNNVAHTNDEFVRLIGKYTDDGNDLIEESKRVKQ